MAEKSKFHEDLSEEQRLGQYLFDFVYPTIKELTNINIQRKEDAESQKLGIDLLLTWKKEDKLKNYKVDEKAQLHYINRNLPTFAFEISSYSKLDRNTSKYVWKQGWLYDGELQTEGYFLVTCIKRGSQNDFDSVRLVHVYRNRLLTYLHNKGLTGHKILEYDKKFRDENFWKSKKSKDKIFVNELDKRIGYFRCTHHLKERPINLVLYINKLIDMKLAKELLPCTLKN
ncbi:MAG: hypothetical protein U9O64_04735 [Campylobacterota bacterium]|nr:hypothetical protein [Campylobacterota bacterium]